MPCERSRNYKQDVVRILLRSILYFTISGQLGSIFIIDYLPLLASYRREKFESLKECILEKGIEIFIMKLMKLFPQIEITVGEQLAGL